MNKLFTILTFAAVSALPASAFDWSADVTPAPGVVTELGDIEVKFTGVSGGWYVDLDSKDDIVLKWDGVPVAGTKASMIDDETLKVAMPGGNALTSPGKYTLEIGENALYADNGMQPEPPVNDTLTYEWTIEATGTVLDFDYTSSLPMDEFLAYFGDVTLTFDKLDKVEYSGEGATVTFNGTPLADVEVKTDGNKLTLTLKDALNFEDGTVEVNIDAEALTGTLNGESAANLKPVTATYKMASPVEYDLALTISSPKPNADGQISAEKSLESFFFRCEQPGLVAATGNAINVTIKEVNGDYEAKGHLRKGVGNFADYTQFSVAFGTEPSYNGIYTITIDKGAFGTAAWAEDPNYGHSNAEIQINFELIDGVDRATYNIEPTKVTPEAGTYATGAEIATVTLLFEEGVEAVDEASATLAGINTSYRETAAFKAVDGGYEVKFPAPTEDGKYLFTVEPGTFGDSDFIYYEEGEASAAISIEYEVDKETGVTIVTVNGASDEIFDLSGRRVKAENPAAGIYVVNGKKVVIKK